MEDDSLRFGPNGGLIFCMEYFANNFDWLEESLGHVEDDYILFDCPGKRWCTRYVVLLWIGMERYRALCPLDCRSDRAVHASACNEAACGATAAVGVSCVWSLPGWLTVHGRDLQGNVWHMAMTKIINEGNEAYVGWIFCDLVKKLLK